MNNLPRYQFQNRAAGGNCIGMLLTGGKSKRFGSDKLVHTIEGQTVAELSAHALSLACDTCFEVGLGLTGLPAIHDSSGQGPLAAIAQSVMYLRDQKILEFGQCALVLAGDVPLITASTLRIVANWPGRTSLVPVVNGREQYLAARWSPESLDRSIFLTKNGLMKVSKALDVSGTQRLSMDAWESQDNQEFLDIDTPDELRKLVNAELICIPDRRSQS